MTHNESTGSKRLTLLLVAAAVLTALLGLAIGVVYLSHPTPTTLSVTAPAGQAILCDFVIDGRAESHRDIVPVTYSYSAKILRFAVIPESESADDLTVELSSAHGGGSVSAAGVTGDSEQTAVGSGTTLMGMTRKHIATMRAARLGSRSSQNPQSKATTSGR